MQNYERPSITWSAPFDMSGYGIAARGYVKALDEFGVNVRIDERPVSRQLAGKGLDDHAHRFLNRLKFNKTPSNAPLVQHQNPDIFRAESTRCKKIGFSVFEMRSIPAHWASKCDMMDEIWTPSHYSKEAFVAGGVPEGKIHVIPHFVDSKVFRPGDRRWLIDNLREFNFLSMFDFTERKCWKNMLKAYWSTFKKKDDVSLTLKVYFGSFAESDQRNIMQQVDDWRNECGFRKRDTSPIYFYGFDVPQALMGPFYCTFDAYVLVSREGFGLTHAEAMACGLPTIGAAVGGNTEFMTQENSFLVECTGDEPVDDATIARNPVFKGLTWPKYDIDGLSWWMKYIYEHPTPSKERAMRGCADVREKLSYEKISRLIVERIQA